MDTMPFRYFPKADPTSPRLNFKALQTLTHSHLHEQTADIVQQNALTSAQAFHTNVLEPSSHINMMELSMFETSFSGENGQNMSLLLNSPVKGGKTAVCKKEKPTQGKNVSKAKRSRSVSESCSEEDDDDENSALSSESSVEDEPSKGGSSRFKNYKSKSPASTSKSSDMSEVDFQRLDVSPDTIKDLLIESDLKKKRLARKAELARVSRKKKKVRMCDLEGEVSRLQQELTSLKQAQKVHISPMQIETLRSTLQQVVNCVLPALEIIQKVSQDQRSNN